MKKTEKFKIELKDSYFDGFEYKGYKVLTKLVIEGQSEYKPLQFSSSKDVYDAFKGLHESDRERFYAICVFRSFRPPIPNESGHLSERSDAGLSFSTLVAGLSQGFKSFSH